MLHARRTTLALFFFLVISPEEFLSQILNGLKYFDIMQVET